MKSLHLVTNARVSKSASSVFLTALIVVSLVVVSALGSVMASGTSVSGIIVTDTTWALAGSPYTLIGNVLVNNGVTLTIQAGVSVNLTSYYIMVNGTLQAVGDNSNPVTFIENQNNYYYPSSSSTSEITFTPFCSGWNNTTSTGCTIQNAVVNVPLEISNLVQITQNKIYQGINVQSSFNALQTGTPVISNNFIQGDITVGSALGSAIIQNNNIVDGGISFGSMNPPNVTVTGNTISGCSTGIGVGCWGPGPNSAVQLIEDNLLINNSEGIVLSDWEGGPGPIIQNNTITNNTVGVCVSYPFGNNAPTLNTTLSYNNIYGNSKYDFQNQQPTTIEATYNW